MILCVSVMILFILVNLMFVVVFHYTFHHIRGDARRRNFVLRVPPTCSDDHATGDAQDHKVLR